MDKIPLRSTRKVVNSDGVVVSSYNYDAFGNIMESTVSEEIAYQYAGQEFDDETGLHNFRARLYDSDLMRFYAVDPQWQTASPYIFCGNSPLMYVDPDGEFAFASAVVIAYKIYKYYRIAETIYNIYDAYQKGGIDAALLTGITSAQSIAIGHATGSVVGGYVPMDMGIGGSMVAGGITGGLTGGTISSMYGGDYLDGVKHGGLSGMFSAAIDYYGSKAMLESGTGGLVDGEKFAREPNDKPDDLKNPEYDLNNIFPDNDARVTSEYGRRTHPVTKKKSFHAAIDVVHKKGGTEYGDKITSISNGTIGTTKSDGKLKGPGDFIKVDVSKKLIIQYYHAKPIEGIKTGQTITTGTIIGTMTETGYTTGAHIHLMFWYKSQAGTHKFNPKHFLKDW